MRSNNKPTLEEIAQKYCEVCFVSFDRALPRQLEEGLQILLCSRCHITVHKCCYDFEPALNVISKDVSQFLCERCKAELPRPPACLVCYGQEGAMKPLQESPDFIHVYCGLVHNQIDVVSYFPTLSFRRSLQYQQLTNICEICMKRNAHDQCAEESCRRKIHTYCAKRTYTVLALETEEPHSWNHHISTGNHGNFDITDEVIPYELMSEEVDEMIKPLADLPLELPLATSLKKKIHKDYTDELRGKRKSTKKLRRGGFSYVLCTLHESNPYCFCQTKEEGQMVLCECCFEWYHQKCINFSAEAAEERFICRYCKFFYEFKKKGVDEVRGGRSDYDISKLQLPLRISMADCMWVMRVIDNRIRGGQASKMLKELSKYPLKSSCMDLLIRQQSRPKLSALAQEVVHELAVSPELLERLKPRRVLDLDASGRPVVLEQNVAYNGRLRRVLQCLSGWGVSAELLESVLSELQFKRVAVSDQYEQIIELCKSCQPYQEVVILKQKAQAYQYLEIVSKVQQNVKIPYSSLEKTHQQIHKNKDIPLYVTDIIDSKIAQVQPKVRQLIQVISTNPENVKNIAGIAQEIQDLAVEPPLEYQQLKREKKLITDLQLYYNKCHGPSTNEMTVAEQIEQLIAWTAIKPSEELIEIIDSYCPATAKPVWERSSILIRQVRSIVLEFEVKEVIKRKNVKQEKLMQLMQSAKEADFEIHSEQVKNFMNSWGPLKEKIDASLGLSLEKVEDYEDITDNLKIINEAYQGLENLGIKIQDQGRVSLSSQLKARKDELEQLQILFTQAQLQKNPLTIVKLIPTLPRSNSLVRQYLSLKKEQGILFNRYTSYIAKISERIELFKSDSKKQRKDQIRENSEKPSLSEFNEFIQTLKQSQVDMSRELNELNRIMANTLDIASKVRKYCEDKHDFGTVKTLDELNVRRKEIDEFRRKLLTVAELSLKTELVDLYHLEIMLRMKNALLTPNIELDKIGFLLKVAEEQNLIHDSMYIELKDRFETKNQRSKQVGQVKSIEQLLAAEANRDNTGNLSSLANYRRGLHFSDPGQMKIRNSYIEQLVEKNKLLRTKISNILSGRTKLEFQEVRPIYLQALKNPFAIPELSRLTPEINKTWDIIRRWKDLNKNYMLNHPIFYDYQGSMFAVEEIENIRRELKNNQEEISTLKFLVESFSEETADQLEDILDRMESNPVVKDTQVCLVGQRHYLCYWLKLLALSRQSRQLISYQKLKRLILDSYNLLQKTLKRGEQFSELNEIIVELQKCMADIKKHLKLYPKFSPDNAIVSGFIDLEDFYLDNEEETDLAELIPLYKPFEDLPKFRVRNLQRVESKREDSSLKRSYSKFEELKGDSEKYISLPPPSSQSSSQEVPQVVSDNERRKIKQIFLKNIRRNPELQKYGECENEVKMIENQIFGQWHNDIVKYFQMSDQFQKLFIKLVNCPNISNKIIKKKFEFKFIELLVKNLQKVDELENMIITKNKQEEAEKNIKEIMPVVAPVAEVAPQPIIASIATGKVDDSMREDLKKEMKILKENREGREHKHKKKKHHKHKDKDRSHSPEAKFSSDSQKEELPKYIESEYNKEEQKQPSRSQAVNTRLSDSPLRYDPEEQQLLKRETIYPKGSILKLKSCEAEIQTRKRGRMEFSVDLFTEEEHKKILELVDPGFSRLPIRKEKNDAEILTYIGKSRKKYRFVIGWMQAVNANQNQFLKELAEEAVQKKKVYGWQNDHIKMHMMSVRQLVTIPRFNAPARVTSKTAAEVLADDRMVFVLQYPERLYELRDQYKSFEGIVCKNEEFPVNVPMPAVEAKPINDYYHNYTVPTIEPLIKPAFKEPEVVYETWGNDVPVPPPMAVTNQPQQQFGLPPKVNHIRMEFNFGNYSPIDSNSEDNEEDNKEREDLATNLINSFDVGKVPPPPQPQPPPPPQREKPQQYQGYYGGYPSYQAPQQQQRPMVDNRWMNYPQMSQSQPQTLYNPLAGRYGGIPQNQMNQGQSVNQPGIGQPGMGQPGMGQPGMGQPSMGGMYKNPLMGQRNPGMQGMGGQYYDPRYQGYQQQ